MIVKKDISKILLLFLLLHLIIWTLVPSITNKNLPLDTIEALAWGSNLDWGFNKHPPFSAFAAELFYQIFGSQDWAYYFLSQIFVVFSFFIIFKLASELFKKDLFAFLSILLLESIYYYNFTSPEFNVNISQLPFWALSVYFTWRCINYDKLSDYIFLGIFIALGILSKYLFLYLLIGIISLFLYLTYKGKKISFFKLFLSGFVTLIIIFPHLIWLYNNDFISLTYGLNRAGGGNDLLDHISFPVLFIVKQLGILTPFMLMTFFLIKKFEIKIKIQNKNIVFLVFTFLVPILSIILTSVIMGAKIRTMWMTPFYLLVGIFIIEIYKKKLNQNLKKFFYVCFVFFFFSPAMYSIVSISNEFKRTDYEGKEIARLVQNKWDDHFRNDIKIVVGDEWYAGNLSYHLSSRPKWIIDLKNKTSELGSDEGVIYTGNPKILKKICPGIYGTIKPVGYCMIGKR